MIRRRAVLTLAAMLGVVVAPLPWRAVSAGDGLQGPLELVSRNGQPIDRGNKDTEFVVRVPDQATCPGDTMHDGWNIDSWILPADEDPTQSHVGRYGPEPRFDAQNVGRRASLYSSDFHPYQWETTQPNPAPGQPARLGDIPVMSMAYFVKYMRLGEGTYHLGLGCDLNGEPTKYWQTDIVITRPDGVDGTTLTWRLATAPAGVPASAPTPWVAYVVAAFALIAGLAAAGYTLRRSARRRVATSPQRSSK